MSEIIPEKVAATTPNPENVAAFLAYCANDAMDDDGNLWYPIVKAEGGVVELAIKPGDEDGVAMDDIVHFRAVVIEGEQTPIVLPAGAAADYINGDDGYKWLTCGTCEESLMEVTAGTSFGEMAAKIAAHKCAAEAAQEQKGGQE